MTDTTTTPTPRPFYSAGPGIDVLQPAPPDAPSALERLGQSPFPKAKFPFLGFLASVYDHVSSHAKTRVPVQKEEAPDVHPGLPQS